jgi:toxin ParE1/3/4
MADNSNTGPEGGRLVPELRVQGISIYRELIVAPWRVIYRIVEHKIYILVVLDAQRNIEDTLLKRLI